MEIRLLTGEMAEARTVDGNLVTLLSPRAFAPGSPIGFSATFDEGERAFEGRTIASKRLDDQRFEVRMRLVNLRRDDRERLLRGIGSSR
jgi:hypothetical protein